MDRYYSCWDVLEIAPTKDKSEIKRAYAKKARTVHPEENHDEFIQVRQAYEQAIIFAKINCKDYFEEENIQIIEDSDMNYNYEISEKNTMRSERFDFTAVEGDNPSLLQHNLNIIFIDDYFSKILKDRRIAANQIIYEFEFAEVVNHKESVIYLLERCYKFLREIWATDTNEIGTLMRTLERRWSQDSEVRELIRQLEKDSRWNRNEEEEQKKGYVRLAIILALLIFMMGISLNS